MSLQPLFRRFEETIKLAHFDENKELRDKRDKVLQRMRENKLKFEPFNQGSYAMRTGVKPLDGDYDIDIGIVFDVDRQTHDPVTVKEWVYKAVQEHTAKVEWRRPCITVYYQQGGEPVYHVDLAILAKDSHTGVLHLAIGKEHSAKDQCEWQQDGRKGFMTAVGNHFSGEDAAQFRRVIRYLKRWKDVHFPAHGRAAPTGLALTVAAYQWFQPRKTGWGTDAADDDLAATLSLVQAIQQRFSQTWDQSQQRYVHRISLQFPFAPWDDVFARMTNQQMQEFYQRIGTLAGLLGEAGGGSTVPLRKAFGSQFPEK